MTKICSLCMTTCYATQDYPTQWLEDNNYFKGEGVLNFVLFSYNNGGCGHHHSSSFGSVLHPISVSQLVYSTDNHIRIL